MKSAKLIVNIYLIGLLILMSCGKKGHETQQDRSNDLKEEPQDSTDHNTNRRNQSPTSELTPKDKFKSLFHFYTIQSLDSTRLA